MPHILLGVYIVVGIMTLVLGGKAFFRTRYPRGRLQISALLGLALVVLVASGVVLAKTFLNYDLASGEIVKATSGSSRVVLFCALNAVFVALMAAIHYRRWK